jgi:hypothetical protein
MSDSTLIVHRGARIVERAELDLVEAPAATATWVPIKHATVLDEVTRSLAQAGFAVGTVKVALSRCDHRLFATLDTSCELAGGVTLAIAVVNSTDRSLPMKFVAGDRVLCCDNLALRSDLMAAVVRKHTRFGLERFREALLRAVSGLHQFREAEAARIARFMATELSGVAAESLMLRSYERGVVSHRLLPELIAQWRKPPFEAFAPRTLWSLENAHTSVLAALARSNPQRFCAVSLQLQALLAEAAGT